MVKLSRIVPEGSAEVWVKLEYLNPSGSHKDRIALSMIEDAERRGILKPGMTIVEATTGNTGLAVALVGRLKGYRVVLTMPETTSTEKVSLMRALGAEVILCPVVEDPSDPRHYARVAERIAREENGLLLNQYGNPANPKVHYEVTAREIWEQMKGQVDAFVMGVGTGGTITGVGRFLKERKPDVLIVAVEPETSIISAEVKGEPHGEPKPHVIEGLIGDRVPRNLDPSIIDRWIKVGDRDAVETALKLASEEGIIAGFSTGAHVYAAIKIAEELGEGKKVVTIAADTGFKYATRLFNEEWLKKYGLKLPGGLKKIS